LLNLKSGFIGAQQAYMLGRKYDLELQENTIQQCGVGSLDAAVVSVKSGKNGCNLQGMTWMVCLGYIGRATEEEQAKGIFWKSALMQQEDVAELGRRGQPSFM
jgi:hypothetical protein